MQTRKIIDYNKIYNALNVLKSTGELNEATSLLFELLLQENFNCHAKINELSKTKADVKPEPDPKACTNCGNDAFQQYLLPTHMGNSGMGMKQGQNTGDLGVNVCTKCNICTLVKPTYWS
jgi:Na+-translocating ferredoxin:NAD+ oxidoreductase RnfC subunit